MYDAKEIRKMMPGKDDVDLKDFEWLSDQIKEEAIFKYKYELNLLIETFNGSSFIDCYDVKHIMSDGQPTEFLKRLIEKFTSLGFKVTYDLDKLTISWKE